MFECVDMCNSLGILPIVDLRLSESSEDIADLVDWLHGASDTEWGAKRIAFGHPEPFNVTHFEFGEMRWAVALGPFLSACAFTCIIYSCGRSVSAKVAAILRCR
jgi:alpha-L-arabinofuranosidase